MWASSPTNIRSNIVIPIESFCGAFFKKRPFLLPNALLFVNFLHKKSPLIHKILLILLLIYDTLYTTKIHIKGEPIL